MSSSTSSGGKRIVVTGGSGKAGRHVIPYLLSKGHKVLNLDLNHFPKEYDPDGKVYTLITDLSDSGQVFNALTAHFNMAEFSLPAPHPPVPDAVIHLAAFARNLLVPDNEMFRSNVMQTYNIIEAGCKLGVPKIMIASSETTYGVCFTQATDEDVSFNEFPLDEDTYDTNPMDSYALSKLCGERMARTFSRRYEGRSEVYAFRVGNVIEPHEYARDFPAFIKDPFVRKRNAWSYIDARDLGQIFHLAVIKKEKLGFQVFNATNDTITTEQSTKEILQKYCPNTKITREMGENEAPLTNKKIKDVLGFKDEHDWRKYYKGGQ